MTPLHRSILRIAVPSIVINITTPLLSLMDVTFTGHMGSAFYLSAIGVGGTLFNMKYWIFAFLRMGTSGLTAQAYGLASTGSEKGQREAAEALWRGAGIAVVSGLVIFAFGSLIAGVGLRLMGVDGETERAAATYFNILCAGAPAVLLTYVFTGWLVGMQDSRSPLWISITINVVNISVSYILVVVCGMKIEGVAIGTLVAQWTGCLMGVFIILWKYHPARPNISSIFDASALKRYFLINSDIFLRTLCLVAVTVWFTRAGAAQGTDILAANTLLMQFFFIFSYFMDGFAFAGEALTGRFIGSKDASMVKKVIKGLLNWGVALGLIFMIVYAIAGTVIVDMLTSDAGVKAVSGEYMAWVIVLPLAGFAAFTFDGIFIGATMTRSMLASMAISTAVYFVAYFSTISLLGNHALWLAFVLYLATRGIVLALRSKKIVNQIS